MCGLYGMISRFKKATYIDTDVAAFFEMSVLTSLRGRDSSSMWGVYKDDYKKEPRVWKTLGDPFYIINDKRGDQVFRFMKNEGKAVFGHGRKATFGKVSLPNAHPFRHKNITLMHNGSIHGGLDGKDQAQEVEVDSHALTILVQEKGIQAALSQVEGAFAIIAYDTNTQKILIARNYQRPLHYVETNDMIYIMSDKKPLEYMMERCSRNGAWVKDFEAMKVYEIDIDDPKLELAATKQITYQQHWKGHNQSYDDIWPKRNGQVIDLTKPVHRLPPVMGSKSFDDTTWKIKRGQKTRFIVEDSVKPTNSANYKFWGQDNEGNHIVFFAPDPHPEWLDKIAQAPIVSAYPDSVTEDTPELVYIVKLKEIDWLSGWEDLTENEKIKVLGTSTCAYCSQAFVEDDVDSLVIVQHRPLTVMHGECEQLGSEVEEALRKAREVDSGHIPL